MKFFLTNFFLIYLSFNCLSLGAQNDPDITRGKIADERRVLMEDLKLTSCYSRCPPRLKDPPKTP